jgi:hypothetical protein
LYADVYKLLQSAMPLAPLSIHPFFGKDEH